MRAILMIGVMAALCCLIVTVLMALQLPAGMVLQTWWLYPVLLLVSGGVLATCLVLLFKK